VDPTVGPSPDRTDFGGRPWEQLLHRRHLAPGRDNAELGEMAAQRWHTDAVSGRRPSYDATVGIHAAGWRRGARTPRIGWTIAPIASERLIDSAGQAGVSGAAGYRS
jgi:hypothetical protein